MIKNSFISVIPQEENKGSVEFQDCVVALKNQHSQNSVLHTHSNGSQKTQKTGNTAHNLLGKSQTYSSTQRTRVTPKIKDNFGPAWQFPQTARPMTKPDSEWSRLSCTNWHQSSTLAPKFAAKSSRQSFAASFSRQAIVPHYCSFSSNHLPKTRPVHRTFRLGHDLVPH